MFRNMVLATAALLLASSSSVAAPSGASNDELVVIVNRSNRAGNLSKGDLRAIFLSKRMRWEDGSKILAVNLPNSNASRHRFDEVVLGMSREDVGKYWVDRRLRGGTGAPKSVSSPEVVVKVVSDSETAVGYVSRADVNQSVKIVATIRGNSVTGS